MSKLLNFWVNIPFNTAACVYNNNKFDIFHSSYHCNQYRIVFFSFLEIFFFFLSFSISFAITFDVVSIHQYGSLPNYDDFCF